MVFLLKLFFFFNFFDNCCMFKIHMFFESFYAICFIICYVMLLLLLLLFGVWIKCIHRIVVTKNTSHDLKIQKINFFIIIYIIKSPTNYIPTMSSPFFHLSMQCLKVSFHFIVFIMICYK
jgi:hypothetical protein